MVIKEKIGNISSVDVRNRTHDPVEIEWYETTKRILHKETKSGKEVVLKFLKENPELKEGDILWLDDYSVIVVIIKPCEAIVIRPKNNFELASVCYEIGNKHMPLFYEEGELMVAYDAPLFNLLEATGYELNTEKRKLVNSLKTTVTSHIITGSSLFDKILKLTTSSPDG